MPVVKVLFGAQLGVGPKVSPVFHEEIMELVIPQYILDQGEEEVKLYVAPQWDSWLHHQTASIIELVDED